MTGHRTTALAMGLVLAATAGPASAVPIARDGVPLIPIVTPDDPSPAERTAAGELAIYLGSAVGSPFRILPEKHPDADGDAIHVGPTAFARSLGVDPERLGPEEWTIRTEAGRLVLAGGRPRGTLYAVSRFLEDEVGVRWWTPFDESIPGRPDLRTGPLRRTGKPAFAYRDFFGLDGPPIFRSHLRLNGNETGLAPDWGGRIRFGMHHVHTFGVLVPPEEVFESNPEFFSERLGFRVGDRSQLCLTEERLPAFLAKRILEIARADRAESEAGGLPPADLYDISPNDWGGACACARCRGAAEREGGDSGPLLALVNRVADIVFPSEPGFRVTTLAYRWTLAPPRDMRAREGVIVRVSGYGVRDQIRTVMHPGNARYRAALEGWAATAPGFWVWDYAISYHDRFALPMPNLRTFGPDLREYRRLGGDGLFIQFDSSTGGELHDLKVWVMAKLAEDPERDSGKLVTEFLRGFYGPAARHVRAYLRLMERAADDAGAVIPADAEPSDFRWLDGDTLKRAVLQFDKAEGAVRYDPVLLRRVREARAALDWAVLAFGDGARFDRKGIAARLRRTWLDRAGARLRPEQKIEVASAVDEALFALGLPRALSSSP